MAQVLMKELNKKYDEVHAVKDVNLHVRDKEFMVLVGPSGCGKSTTLRMVAGLEEITAGEITIGDRVVNDLPPKDRDIAMVFQNYALYPHMTVFDNLAFGLRRRRVPAADVERRVNAAAETLGLGRYLARHPRELSGGERQRVALGRALVREPLGNEVLVYWQTPVGTLISRVPGQEAPGVGDDAQLHFAYAKIRLFDPPTEPAGGGGAIPVS